MHPLLCGLVMLKRGVSFSLVRQSSEHHSVIRASALVRVSEVEIARVLIAIFSLISTGILMRIVLTVAHRLLKPDGGCSKTFPEPQVIGRDCRPEAYFG